MDYRKLIENLTPDIYRRLVRAQELGKWPDGSELSDEQKVLCMEAIINWEAEHLPLEQRTGYIDRGAKRSDEQCATEQVLTLADKPQHQTPGD